MYFEMHKELYTLFFAQIQLLIHGIKFIIIEAGTWMNNNISRKVWVVIIYPCPKIVLFQLTFIVKEAGGWSEYSESKLAGIFLVT